MNTLTCDTEPDIDVTSPVLLPQDEEGAAVRNRNDLLFGTREVWFERSNSCTHKHTHTYMRGVTCLSINIDEDVTPTVEVRTFIGVCCGGAQPCDCAGQCGIRRFCHRRDKGN